MSEQSARQRPDRKATVRNLSLLGVAFLAIGTTIYVAVPAWSGTAAVSAGARPLAANARPSATSTLPGPMPGAPTQRPTPPAAPSIGPHIYRHITPRALRPANLRRARIWDSGRGGKALARVTALADNALLAQQTGQYALMLPECQALEGAAGKALLAEPIPDLAMQAKYTTALLLFKLAALGCVAGIQQVPEGVEDTVTHVNQVVMAQVASELSSGASDLFAATEMLRKQ
jgi:hypothetical protein